MATDFHEWGQNLSLSEVKNAPDTFRDFVEACDRHPACEIYGYAKRESPDQFIIILDIGDGTFELDNEAGILRVERIAVSCSLDSSFYWEARPFRKDFPVTLHQNHVVEGEPRSLCLYMESWESVERTWTPQSFLTRILWWLRSTADGSIHADDQPIEQLFFESPYIVLLPQDHFEKATNPAYKLTFEGVEPDGAKELTLRGKYLPVEGNNCQEGFKCIPINISLAPIENGPLEAYPTSLGSLQELVIRRGADLLEPLKTVIEEQVGTSGIAADTYAETQFVLVILGVPRTRNGVVEKTEVFGFAIKTSLGELGESLGTLYNSPTDGKWYVEARIGGTEVTESDNWKKLMMDPLRIQQFPSEKDIRVYSGLEETDSGPTGILAGVGSLGSTMADLWAREAWGTWNYVDSDIIQAHNIARHIAPPEAIGFSKVQIVRLLTGNLYEKADITNENDYVGSITDENPRLTNMINQADILVDATTTLYVPRELAEVDTAPRIASVFFTPSGSASVLLLEDKQRTIRAPQLEAQYYRAILESEWGKAHLDGHYGHFWVGAGCRDVSVTLSNELVKLHGAILARQLRKSTSNVHARICIWDYHDKTGAISPYEIPVAPIRSVQVGHWRVIWDLGFEKRIRDERLDYLPNETGGMLMGIVDQKTKSISLVAWSPQPADSIATPRSFVRGQEGQKELILECEHKTAGIVSYIGEWHSHPPGYPSDPSSDDQKQLASTTGQFSNSGITPIMMIVAEQSVGICMEENFQIASYD